MVFTERARFSTLWCTRVAVRVHYEVIYETIQVATIARSVLQFRFDSVGSDLKEANVCD